MVNPVQSVFGLLVAGLASYRRANYITLLGEQLDAIGSTTPVLKVEPADWNVFLTRVIGGGVALFGAAVLAIGLVAPWPYSSVCKSLRSALPHPDAVGPQPPK